MTRILLLCALLSLTACRHDRKPEPPVTPRVVTQTVTRYVQVPTDLAADCKNEKAREQTYAEAKRLALKRDEYLDECTKRMRRIRSLGEKP